VLTDAQTHSFPAGDDTHRLSTAEYERMVDLGALDELGVELLDGLLIDMSPQSPEHVRVVRALMRLFAARVAILRVQMPLAVADGWLPEPDVALVEDHPDQRTHPSTALIVAEVAVSSQTVDRLKAVVYARAGVPRYWLIDVPKATVTEYTGPSSEGYESIRRLTGTEVLDARLEGVPTTTVTELLAG
jgi:Uma2 family endonuclease